jgi:tetratricopeptide (TPR) repeat protein
VCFNLGNVLCALDQPEAAAERLRQAVELRPAFPEAWNNLGNVLAGLRQFDAALACYRSAVEHDPQYRDAHYNLADTLDDIGRGEEARPHWQTYLRCAPKGPPADYARSRLAALDLQRLG